MAEHQLYVCAGEHDWPSCMFCDGGLSACAVCGCFEGAWTTDCPGSNMGPERLDEVYKGKWDFRLYEGGWVRKPSYEYAASQGLGIAWLCERIMTRIIADAEDGGGCMDTNIGYIDVTMISLDDQENSAVEHLRSEYLRLKSLAADRPQ